MKMIITQHRLENKFQMLLLKKVERIDIVDENGQIMGLF